MDSLLTPADAARILGVVPATVRTMAISGKLPPTVTTESGIRLFRRSDVERFAAERAALGKQNGRILADASPQPVEGGAA